MSSEAQIKEILERYGENPRDATWKVQCQTVIYHKALERIAAKADIWFDAPTIVRAERDEAVVLVTGYIGEVNEGQRVRREWSIGEALVTDGTAPGNYRVSGRQAAYPYAMAEKRAKDRVILKLIGLHGLLYSEEEADEFKEAPPKPAQNGTRALQNAPIYLNLETAMRDARTLDALKDIPISRKADFEKLTDEQRADLRSFYTVRARSFEHMADAQ
jgi:hypothetical protein